MKLADTHNWGVLPELGPETQLTEGTERMSDRNTFQLGCPLGPFLR